jgi:hypothetical protein
VRVKATRGCAWPPYLARRSRATGSELDILVISQGEEVAFRVARPWLHDVERFLAGWDASGREGPGGP